MAQKITVQDGIVVYTTSNPATQFIDFNIDGQLNVAANLNVGNDPLSPGIITTSSGQSLTITTGAGGNLTLAPSGALLFNGVTWPSLSLINPGQFIGASVTNTLAFYSFVLATVGSDTLTSAELYALYPNAQPGQWILGPTVTYQNVALGQWRTSAPALGYTPVNKAGDTMLGYLILNADPVNNLGAATKQYVDRISTGININGSVDTSTTPSSNLSTPNSYTPGTSGPPPDTGTGVGGYLSSIGNVALGTIGGDSTLAVGSRILVQNQVNQKENGVYVVTSLGSVSTPWVLTRASDYNNSSPGQVHAGNLFFVENGTLAGTQWAEIDVGTGADGIIIIDTDNIVFTQFAGPGTFTGGAGINVASNTITNTGVLSNIAATGISVSGPTGNVTIGNTGVLSILSGPGISVSNPTGNVTLSVNGLSSSIISAAGPINTTEVYISNNSFIVPTTNAGDTYRITIYGTCTSTAENTHTFNLRFGTGGNLSDTAFYTSTLSSAGTESNTPLKLEFICTATSSSPILFQTTGSYINSAWTGFDSVSGLVGVFNPSMSSALIAGTNILGISYLSSSTNTSCSFQNVLIEAIR